MSELPKVLKYKPLIELFSSDLDSTVNKHLGDGWQLHGNPFVVQSLNEDVPGTYLSFHCQAVIKEDYPF